jgi:flagellar assembly protein FliH
LKAYELWQFASLADDAPKRTRHAAAEPAPGPSAAAVAAHELAVLRETARADGHGAGFAAGRADGLAAAQAEMDHLRRLAAAIAGAYADMQDETAEALLTLALDTARHVLRTELQTQPEAMLPAIREAVDLAGGGAHPQLLLNPGDIGFVQRHLGADLTPGGWRLAEDARIEPGGCRITTTNGAIDSTLKTRWQRVVAALGRNDPWLEAVAVIPAAAPVPPADVVAGPMADEAADPAASLDAEAG